MIDGRSPDIPVPTGSNIEGGIGAATNQVEEVVPEVIIDSSGGLGGEPEGVNPNTPADQSEIGPVTPEERDIAEAIQKPLMRAAEQMLEDPRVAEVAQQLPPERVEAAVQTVLASRTPEERKRGGVAAGLLAILFAVLKVIDLSVSSTIKLMDEPRNR